MAAAELIVRMFELYAAIGIVVALYFVVFALGRFGNVTIGARLLLIPAAVGLCHIW
ncbi:MAG: hypothetical protein WDN69_19615 [Aliidongia sp.]